MQKRKRKPHCVIIAGPNGAGKTTFARRYLPENAGVIHFVNADLIAGGFSPLKPQLAAIAAARMVLREIDRPEAAARGEESMKTKTRTKTSRSQSFAAGVGRALRRAAKDARKTARMHGTPLYVWEDGKVVAKKP